MLSIAFATRTNLRVASRLPAWSQQARISTAELALLLACGALAAVAVGMLQMRIALPGHAILRAVIPMALGLAMVPRRSAGTVMSCGAAMTALAMQAVSVGNFQPAALLGVLALGPVLDAVLVGRPTGWRLYARFSAGGALANLAAFAVRFGIAWLGWEPAHSRGIAPFWSMALVSFLLCGLVAGLVSAAFWFRLRANDDLRRP